MISKNKSDSAYPRQPSQPIFLLLIWTGARESC